MNTIRNRTGLLAGSAVLIAGAVNAEMVYTFDNHNDGWGTINSTALFGWVDAVQGVRAADGGGSDIWYFSAPVIDMGDHSALFGGTMSYDLFGERGIQGSVAGAADVMLVGGGYSIGVNTGARPINGVWSTFDVNLSSDADWKQVASMHSGTLGAQSVSNAVIQAVLADLQGVYIRGEYSIGNDTVVLDNVSLVPAPGAMALLAFGGLAARRRR